MAFKIWIGDAEINIELCTVQQADAFGLFNVTATASTVVDTDVTIPFQWIGNSFSFIQNSITIFSGNTCATNTYGPVESGETISPGNFTFNGAITNSPASENQIYIQGSANVSDVCEECA